MSIAATTSTTSTGARRDAPRLARWALVLALLGVPGSTVAWALPAGGFWIGVPLALAAIVLAVRALREGAASGAGRPAAIGALVLAGAELLLMAIWTLAG